MAVIAGTDLAQSTRGIVDVAAAMARARQDRLVLVHAVDGPVFAHHRRALDAESARVGWGALQCDLLVESGTVADVIAHAVQQHQGELVVVGAHGERRHTHLGPLLGSSATAVLRRVERPLLVVRAADRLTPLLPGGASHQRLKALVCVALDDTQPAVVEALAVLAAAADIDAHVVLFQPVFEVSPEREDAVRLAMRDVVETLGPLPARVRAFPLVRDAYGRLDTHISDLARASHVDIVVCGSHHRHGLDRVRQGSVAEGIVRHAPVSVLVGAAPAAPHRASPGGAA